MDKVIFFFFFELTNVSLLYFSRVGNMFLKGILWKQRLHQRTETRVCIFPGAD